MAHITFENINKIYPNGVQAVFDFNLEIKDQEFIVLVGPSGCGKSTMLRMIAGLESITSGEMKIDGVRVNEKPPVDRDIAMIFQDYALYGNMTVYENMAFSLTVRKKHSDEVFDRVYAVSDTVKLKDQLNRFPKNLSGGQRQRVALGRSIVRDAKVFLMDEPLSNLDAKLRLQTRREIIMLHNQLKATIIYVTHDQIEAMTMATRMIVMYNGRIQQVGTPYEIYHHPCNLFVAGFIGNPPMNFIHGKIENGYFVAQDLSLKLSKSDQERLKHQTNVIMGVRPEHFYLDCARKNEADIAILSVNIEMTELLGSTTTLRFPLAGQTICASVDTDHLSYIQSTLTRIAIDMTKVHFFNSETEMTLNKVVTNE